MAGPLQRRVGLGSVVGLVALGTALALTSPGVRVVEAGEPAPEVADGPASYAPAPGPACSASPSSSADDFQRAMKQARRRAMLRLENGGEQPVMLNNRGYNYGSTHPSVDPRLLAVEQRVGR